jgi:phosphoglycerate dehydrogenase-like enzyme
LKRKMVFMMNLSQGNVQQVEQILPDWEIIHGKDSSVWLPHLQDAEILVNWNEHAEKECLTENSKLRWVHTWSAGVNSLPMDKFKERNILLTNSSGVHAYPISETVFAMILAYTRHLHVYIRNQVNQTWDRGKNKLEAHGKTIGIIGVGAIGKETAKLAKAFGMRVLGLRRSGQTMPEVDQMYDERGLNEVLSESDYVILTLPLTKDTHHMIGNEQFAAMKSNSFFINIGRGETTDTNALINALQNGQIAGAGLDVFEEEPLPKDSPLWNMENVIITPHTSGDTGAYNDRVMDILLPNLKQYLDGQQPDINLVDLDQQY